MSYNRVHAVVTALLAQAAIAVAYGQTAQLEEIVVTAQKRAENLQDTPIAISAVTGDAIEKLNYDVFNHRAYVPRVGKFLDLPLSYLIAQAR